MDELTEKDYQLIEKSIAMGANIPSDVMEEYNKYKAISFSTTDYKLLKNYSYDPKAEIDGSSYINFEIFNNKTEKNFSEYKSKKFDLNIDEILESWEKEHAIREFIANAIDEQKLTSTKEIKIYQDDSNCFHIRDFGRGLEYNHFVQNENLEKLNTEGLIGRFGVGLKDALATLHRNRIQIVIVSKHGVFRLEKSHKSGFENLETLHVLISPPIINNFEGTDVILHNVTEQDIQKAKNMFLQFSGTEPIEKTVHGEIYPTGGAIYINGIKVSEEENFLFSYNITKLNKSIEKALNRERTNVGRTAYTDTVKKILLNSRSSKVAEALTSDLQNITHGTERDEIRWVDIQTHAIKLLNVTGKSIFLTHNDMQQYPNLVSEAIESGKNVTLIPDSVKYRILGEKDFEGNDIVDMVYFDKERTLNFSFEFVKTSNLTKTEQQNLKLSLELMPLLGVPSQSLNDVLVSETMQKDSVSYKTTNGLYQTDKKRIILRRSILSDLEQLCATFLHELGHARSNSPDVTVAFEDDLTKMLGQIGMLLLEKQKAPIIKKQLSRNWILFVLFLIIFVTTLLLNNI